MLLSVLLITPHPACCSFSQQKQAVPGTQVQLGCIARWSFKPQLVYWKWRKLQYYFLVWIQLFIINKFIIGATASYSLIDYQTTYIQPLSFHCPCLGLFAPFHCSNFFLLPLVKWAITKALWRQHAARLFFTASFINRYYQLKILLKTEFQEPFSSHFLEGFTFHQKAFCLSVLCSSQTIDFGFDFTLLTLWLQITSDSVQGTMCSIKDQI